MATQTEIQNTFIKGITWKVLGSILLATISITGSVVQGFNSLKTEVRSIRYEFRTAIDSVKVKQMQNKYESEIRFQKLDSKLESIEKNTSK